jgi:hypothetical protein
MLFQNIVKMKKNGGRSMGGTGVGTPSPNRGCTADASIQQCWQFLPFGGRRWSVEMLLVLGN